MLSRHERTLGAQPDIGVEHTTEMSASFIESAAIAQFFYRGTSIIALVAGPENYLPVLDVTFFKLAPTTFFHNILPGM